jgi:signal transduction histidine kinase
MKGKRQLIEDNQEEALDFEALFRCVPAPLVVLEPAPGYTVLDATDAFLRTRRLSRESLVGQAFLEAFPERAEVLRPSLDRVVSTRMGDNYNVPVLGADGAMRYILHRLEAPELELLRSVRERDEAIRDLGNVKEDLEAFAYSASHDLRAPLRAIGGFCAMLRSVQSPGLTAQAQEFLGRIDSSVKQMTAIVDGLLELSRVEKTPLVRRSVDITSLARRVVRELKLRDPCRSVAVQIEDGLQARADERLLLIVMQNLIGNAWKYTGGRAEARIDIGCRRVVGQDVFHVRDNGVGFDMALAGKLFTPFVRLHAASEFEGHGIGLATVKRAIDRHHGQVWAEARPGHGATVRFTLAAWSSPQAAGAGPDLRVQ